MAGVKATELSPDLQKELGVEPPPNEVPEKFRVLGKLLTAIAGATTRDALWALGKASEQVRSVRNVAYNRNYRAHKRRHSDQEE